MVATCGEFSLNVQSPRPQESQAFACSYLFSVLEELKDSLSG